jgi:hypothetical protein
VAVKCRHLILFALKYIGFGGMKILLDAWPVLSVACEERKCSGGELKDLLIFQNEIN